MKSVQAIATGAKMTRTPIQYIKEQKGTDLLYVSADDIYFSNHRLTEVADEFYKNGGKRLFIDEIAMIAINHQPKKIL